MLETYPYHTLKYADAGFIGLVYGSGFIRSELLWVIYISLNLW